MTKFQTALFSGMIGGLLAFAMGTLIDVSPGTYLALGFMYLAGGWAADAERRHTER